MKPTDHFKNTIKAYLDKRTEEDILFSFQYSKPNKSIDECCTYILNQVQKSGCNGFHDDEIFGMAVHYYDEDTIEAGNAIHAHVIVNHTIELTAEEKEQARKDAIQRAQNEAYNKMMQPKKKAASKQTPNTNQLTLF